MQTVHAQDIPIAYPGMVADSGLVQDTISRLVEDAAGARAGTLLVPGTDTENQAIVATSAGEITDGDGLGIVMYDASKAPATSAAAIAAGNEYDDEESVPLVQKGRIWVLCDAAATIAANTPAFVRHVAAGAEVLGAFREDVDGTDASALPSGVFRSAHSDVVFQGDTYRIALLEINLPVT